MRCRLLPGGFGMPVAHSVCHVYLRHRGLLLGLRCPNSTPIILAVRVQQADHPIVTAIDGFLPMNAPQPASSVTWTVLDLVRAPHGLISQSEGITAAVIAHLKSRSTSLMSCDTGQVVECDAPTVAAKFTLHLVFFDADSRPLFVTATSGILSVDDFDEIMCARRGSLFRTPTSPPAAPVPWRTAPFGAESPDSDSDEPWS
ncbi:unnamed protein product [Schistocephalus solidus]|uniref:DUF5753 domain-containing protein n=1 Tax=Schistocephalus solidus TaxID=70667 RepID=A0A183T686_SCHSO|nr:unnamed protein product [Schistocephalus solidus]